MSRRLIAFLWLFSLPAFAGHFTANLKTYVQGGLPAAYIRLSIVGCGTGWWGSGGNIPSVSGSGVMVPDLLGGVEVWPDSNGLVDAQVQDDSVVSCAGTTGSAYYKVAIWSGSKNSPVMRRELVANYYHITSADFDLANPGAPLNPPSPGLLGPIPVDATSLRGTLISQTAPTDGQSLVYNLSLGKYVPGTPSGVSSHNLLSGSHSDTAAASVVRGDLMVGNSTPAWSRFAKGAQYLSLVMGANDPAWGAVPLDQAAAVSGNLPITHIAHGTANTLADLDSTAVVPDAELPMDNCFVHRQAGTDFGQQLGNCIASIATTGRTADGEHYSAATSIASTLTISTAGVRVKLPNQDISLGVGLTGTSNPAIKITGSDITLEGGPNTRFLATAAGQTLLRITNPSQTTGTLRNLTVDAKEGDLSLTVSSSDCTAMALNSAGGDILVLVDNNTDQHRQVVMTLPSTCPVISLATPIMDKSFTLAAQSQVSKLVSPPLHIKLKNILFDCASQSGATFGLRFDFASISELENVRAVNCDTGIQAQYGYGNSFRHIRTENSGSNTSASLFFQSQTNAKINDIEVESRGKANAFGVNFYYIFGSQISNGNVDGGGTNGRGSKFLDFGHNSVTNWMTTNVGGTGGSEKNAYKFEHGVRHNTFTNLQAERNNGQCALFSEEVTDNEFVGPKCQHNTFGGFADIYDPSRQLTVNQTLSINANTPGAGQATVVCVGCNWAALSNSYDGKDMLVNFSGWANSGNNDWFTWLATSADGLTMTIDTTGKTITTEASRPSVQVYGTAVNARNHFVSGEYAYNPVGGGGAMFNLLGNDYKIVGNPTIAGDANLTYGVAFKSQTTNPTLTIPVSMVNLRTRIDATFSGWTSNHDIDLTNSSEALISGWLPDGVNVAGTGVNNRITDAKGAKPTCSAVTRGSQWYTESANGTADLDEVCRKNATDAYAWIARAQTLGSTAVLGTSAVNAGTCASAVTVATSGAATSSVISWDFASDPSGVTGYGSSGGLTIVPYATSGNANFKVCNPTGGNITPGAMTLNFKVHF